MNYIGSIDGEYGIHTFNSLIGCEKKAKAKVVLKHHIDHIEYKNGLLILKGWAFDQGLKEGPDYIYIKTNEKIFFFVCGNDRPDVKKVFSLKDSLVGFIVSLEISDDKIQGFEFGVFSNGTSVTRNNLLS